MGYVVQCWHMDGRDDGFCLSFLPHHPSLPHFRFGTDQQSGEEDELNCLLLLQRGQSSN